MTNTSRCRILGKWVKPETLMMALLVYKACRNFRSCRVKLYLVWMIKVRLQFNWVRQSTTSHIFHLRWNNHHPSQLSIWDSDWTQRPRSEETIMVFRVDRWKEYILNLLDILSKGLILMSSSTRKTRSLRKWFCHKSSLGSLMTSTNLKTHLRSTKLPKKCLFSEKSKEN